VLNSFVSPLFLQEIRKIRLLAEKRATEIKEDVGDGFYVVNYGGKSYSLYYYDRRIVRTFSRGSAILKKNAFLRGESV